MAGRVPPEVSAAIADRAASLRGQATGRVLDLDNGPLTTPTRGVRHDLRAFRRRTNATDHSYRRLHKTACARWSMHAPRTDNPAAAYVVGHSESGDVSARPIAGLHLGRDIRSRFRRAALRKRSAIASRSPQWRQFVSAVCGGVGPVPDAGARGRRQLTSIVTELTVTVRDGAPPSAPPGSCRPMID